MTSRYAPRSLNPPTPATQRRPWLTLADAARTIAGRLEACTGGDPNMPGHPLADFRHLLRGMRASDFPVQAASAVVFAEAFLKLAQAFVSAGLPHWRADFAPALETAARAIEALLHEQRAQEAANTWNRRGD